MHAKSLQYCLILCDPIDCSPSGSSVHGILQVRILKYVAMPSSGVLPDPGIKLASLTSSTLAGRFFTTSATWEAQILYIYIIYNIYISHVCIHVYIAIYIHTHINRRH